MNGDPNNQLNQQLSQNQLVQQLLAQQQQHVQLQNRGATQGGQFNQLQNSMPQQIQQQQAQNQQRQLYNLMNQQQSNIGGQLQQQNTAAQMQIRQGQTGLQFASLQGANQGATQAQNLNEQLTSQNNTQNQLGQNYNEDLFKQLQGQKISMSQLGAQRQGQLMQGANLNQMILQNGGNQGHHQFQQNQTGLLGINQNAQTQQQQLQGQFRNINAQGVQQQAEGRFSGLFTQPQDGNKIQNQQNPLLRQASQLIEGAQTQQQQQNPLRNMIGQGGIQAQLQSATPAASTAGLQSNTQTAAQYGQGMNSNQIQQLLQNQKNELLMQKQQTGQTQGAAQGNQVQVQLMGLNGNTAQQTANQNLLGNTSLVTNQAQNQKAFQDILAAQNKQKLGFNGANPTGQNFATVNSGSVKEESRQIAGQQSLPQINQSQQVQSSAAISNQGTMNNYGNAAGLNKPPVGQAGALQQTGQDQMHQQQYQIMQKQQKTAEGQNPGQSLANQQPLGAAKTDINSNIHQIQFMSKLGAGQQQTQQVPQQNQQRLGGPAGMNQMDQNKQQLMVPGMQQNQGSLPGQALNIQANGQSVDQNKGQDGLNQAAGAGQLNLGGALGINGAQTQGQQAASSQPGGSGVQSQLLIQKLNKLSSEQQIQGKDGMPQQQPAASDAGVNQASIAANSLQIGTSKLGEPQAPQDQSGATGGITANLQRPGGHQIGPEVASQLASIEAKGRDGDNLVYIDRINKLAEYCATNGEYQVAIECYVKLITIDSENGPAWTALGHCYLLVEDLQNSFNAYQRALYSLEDIKDPQLWYGIGILYEKFESYDHAISALIAVLKMSPNFYQKSEVLYKLGMIFAKTNQIQQAISYFQNSILTNTFTLKRKTDTLIKIGMLYEEQKDFNQAMREYEAATIGDKSNYKIYLHMAWCSFQMGKINKALEYINNIEQLHPYQADTLYIQGRCHMALDNNKKALEHLQEAAFKYPGESAYWATLAIVYYKNGDYSDSFENIIKATSLNTFKPEIWYNLGILYEKCKQPEEALIAYTKVKDLCPGDEDALKRIAAIESPLYNSQNGQNQSIFNLQMKQPVFTLPNSLTILKKYKKTQPKDGENKEGTGELPVQGQSLVTPQMQLNIQNQQQNPLTQNLDKDNQLNAGNNDQGFNKIVQQAQNAPHLATLKPSLYEQLNNNQTTSNMLSNFQNQLNDQSQVQQQIQPQQQPIAQNQQPTQQQQSTQHQQPQNAVEQQQPRLNIPPNVAGSEALIQSQIQQQQQQNQSIPQALNPNQAAATAQQPAQPQGQAQQPMNFIQNLMTQQNQAQQQDKKEASIAQSAGNDVKQEVSKPSQMIQQLNQNFSAVQQPSNQLTSQVQQQPQVQQLQQNQNFQQIPQQANIPQLNEPLQQQPNPAQVPQNQQAQQQWKPPTQQPQQLDTQSQQQPVLNQNVPQQIVKTEEKQVQEQQQINQIEKPLGEQQQIQQPIQPNLQQEVPGQQQQIQNQNKQNMYGFQPQQNQMQNQQQAMNMYAIPQSTRGGVQNIQQISHDANTSQVQNNKTVSSHDQSHAAQTQPQQNQTNDANTNVVSATPINEASQQQQPPQQPITVNGLSLEQHSIQQIQEKIKQDQIKMNEFQNPQNQPQKIEQANPQKQEQIQQPMQQVQYDQQMPNATVEGSQNISLQFDQQSQQQKQQFVNNQPQRQSAPLGFVQNQFGIVDQQNTNDANQMQPPKPPVQVAQQSDFNQNAEAMSQQKMNEQMQAQMNNQQQQQQQQQQQLQAMAAYQNFTQPQSVTNQHQMNQAELQNQFNQQLNNQMQQIDQNQQQQQQQQQQPAQMNFPQNPQQQQNDNS